MQSTIAFFRTEKGAMSYAPAESTSVDGAVKQLRAKAVAMQTPKPRSAAQATRRPPRKVANGGFAFDLDGASDEQDASFRRA